jgi:3D (Asp-Asp-Asp) domain-containing protein
MARRTTTLIAFALWLGACSGVSGTSDAHGQTTPDGKTADAATDSDASAADASETDVATDATDSPSADDAPEIDAEDASLSMGDPLGTYWITYYYLALEENYSGADDTVLYGDGCSELARVPSDYAEAICIEGSGRLDDGTVVNYATRCECGGACDICWAEMDQTRFPWGQGSRGNALEPLRSWAVDTDLIAHGTVLYVEEWDGVEIPAIDGLGGFTHDGCFRADDVGGGIDGNHFDLFAGTPDMWRALEQIHPTRTEFTVYANSERCSL